MATKWNRAPFGEKQKKVREKERDAEGRKVEERKVRILGRKGIY